jgi:mannan polymerase II complex MNN10 subunit
LHLKSIASENGAGRKRLAPAMKKITPMSYSENREFSVGIVTLWTPEIKSYSTGPAADKASYCQKWGHGFYPYEESLDPERKPTWSKIIALQDHLSSHEWLFWSDADAVITNHTIDIRDYCDFDYDLIISHDHNGFNAGSFLIRNKPIAHDFLRRVWEKEITTYHYEQTAMIKIMQEMPDLRVKVVDKRQFNSYWFDHRPGDFIFHAAGEDNNLRIKLLKVFSNAAIRE